MQAFDDAGIRVYALSYDEQAALADFADAYNISYTFLSDSTSKVIRQFGILNTIIPKMITRGLVFPIRVRTCLMPRAQLPTSSLRITSLFG